MDDDREIFSALARMRELMFKRGGNDGYGSCSDPLECALQVEQDYIRLHQQLQDADNLINECGRYFVWMCQGPYGASPCTNEELLKLIQDYCRERIYKPWNLQTVNSPLREKKRKSTEPGSSS